MDNHTPSLFDSLPSRKPHWNEHPRTAPEPPSIPGTRWLPLTRGQFALIDAADYPLVCEMAWCLHPMRCTTYAVSGTGLKGKRVYLHRLLMDAPSEMQVDHIDGNGLNCRRSNLRIVSCQQNRFNTGKTNSVVTSRFMGVSWDKTRGKWRATAKRDRRHLYIGRYATEEQAARAYDAKARELFCEFARLNFPEGGDGE
jgi:hypothetical protein